MCYIPGTSVISQETSGYKFTGLYSDGEVLRAPCHMHLNLWSETYEISSAIIISSCLKDPHGAALFK